MVPANSKLHIDRVLRNRLAKYLGTNSDVYFRVKKKLWARYSITIPTVIYLHNPYIGQNVFGNILAEYNLGIHIGIRVQGTTRRVPKRKWVWCNHPFSGGSFRFIQGQ
ncbi:hypothetical protein HZ99_21495 [Pseudomonas fluorescens]|nr:hypothetical protein HZ99_21495 [Pseudomonas fluorescens]